MESFRTPSLFMSERLDPGHYRPVLLENEEKLSRFGAQPLIDLYRRSGIGHTSAVTPHYTTDVDGVPFISGGCIVAGSLDPDQAERIKHSAHLGIMKGSRLQPGFVLLVRKGELGNSAVVPPAIEVNCSSEVMFLDLNPGVDPGFLSSYFNSRHGRMAFLRQQRGMMITSISLYDVPELPAPRVNDLTARYIGDKVRQAERLRSHARALEASVAMVHAKHISPPVGIDFGKRTRRLPSNDLTERLDAHFYPAAVEQYLKQVGGQTKSLETLTSLVTNGQTEPEAEIGVLQATVTNLGRGFLEGELRTVERPANNSRMLSAHDLLLCNAAHNKSYIGRNVSYCQTDAGVYPSTEVMLLRVDREQVPASFIRHYLKSDIGFLQIQSTIRGISAHSYPGDVRLIKVPIPNVPAVDRAEWFATDDRMLRAGQCVDAARLLTVAAIQLVESLIECKRSEADFVAAQKGLESGDQSRDRALIQTLCRNANGDGPGLFTDLDALYALINDADKAGGGD
ncbi:hypothetical protein AB7Z32_40130 [Bradyrhizobium sp. 482_C4_N1_1]|uniref:hypothetical protein n=1 Tax=unclassified Bradyrhizobium TaxID=2631580 RepID=UPI003F88A1A3